MKGEASVLDEMRAHYEKALERVNENIAALSERDDLPGIRQREFQEMLAEQIGSALDELRSGAYSTLEGYLKDSYEDGFIGTMYNLQKQGVPLAFPIDQESMARAVLMTVGDVKLSKRVYDNVSKLKKQVIAEITRGFADASHVTQIAQRMVEGTDIAAEIKRNVKGRTDQAFRRAMTIARTEKGRVMSDSRLDAMRRAKANGADIVKQWDSTMDSRTRPEHVEADGQIRELEEPFTVGGRKGMAPHRFGIAAQDVNCRCTMLQRSRTALEMPEGDKYTKWDGVNQCYVDLSDAKNYGEFKERHLELVIESRHLERGKKKLKSGRYSVTQDDIDAVIARDLPNVKIPVPVTYNPRLRYYGTTVYEEVFPGYNRVVRIEIGPQKDESDAELRDTILHELLEARIIARAGDLYAGGDDEIHPYIDRVIAKYVRMKGL